MSEVSNVHTNYIMVYSIANYSSLLVICKELQSCKNVIRLATHGITGVIVSCTKITADNKTN